MLAVYFSVALSNGKVANDVNFMTEFECNTHNNLLLPSLVGARQSQKDPTTQIYFSLYILWYWSAFKDPGFVGNISRNASCNYSQCVNSRSCRFFFYP